VTLVERAESYNSTFPDRPPMRANARWLEGCWIGGNNYRGSGYYGAYPPDYLDRVAALFPDHDVTSRRVLHLFSGSLTADATIRGVRIDVNPNQRPDVVGDALALPFVAGAFDLVLADTPYGQAHMLKYAAKMPPAIAKRHGRMPDRLRVIREAARVTRPGGYLVWLDTKLPMFSKRDWHWCGTVQVVRSTNHDYRGVAIFERVAA
jgi:hypothetical protein